MRPEDKHIFNKLHIKGMTTVPYTGWYSYTDVGGYGREVLPELYNELGYKVGAEIGVMNGDFSLLICEKVPGVKMFCIDPWTPYGRRVTQGLQDRRFRRAQNKLNEFGVTFIKKTSMDALADIPDGSLDFIYIDAIHEFDFVMMDLICWAKKVRPGGMISGHDYVNLHGCGVIPAVNAYTRGNDIHTWYVTVEFLASFFWVK